MSITDSVNLVDKWDDWDIANICSASVKVWPLEGVEIIRPEHTSVMMSKTLARSEFQL